MFESDFTQQYDYIQSAILLSLADEMIYEVADEENVFMVDACESVQDKLLKEQISVEATVILFTNEEGNVLEGPFWRVTPSSRKAYGNTLDSQ